MKIRLILIRAGRTLQRLEFDDSDQVTIGRGPGCDLVIDNEAVSRQHCEIVRKGEVFQLRDLGSDNGTYIRGRKITRPFNLNHTDTIELGKFSVRFEDDALEEDRAFRAKPTSGRLTAKTGFSRQHLSHVTAYFEQEDGSAIVLEKAACLIGKRSDCHLHLEGRKSPEVAAVLLSTEQGFRILDVSPLGQAVRLNGVAARDAWLSEDDVLVIGEQTLTFHRGRPLSS